MLSPPPSSASFSFLSRFPQISLSPKSFRQRTSKRSRRPRPRGEDRLCNLGLPVPLILAVNLRRDGEALSPLEQAGTHHNLVFARRGLVVVDVRGAVGAVVAVDRFARVARVGVYARLGTLGDLQVGFVGELVHGGFPAGEDFAGVAVAVCLFQYLGMEW